MLLHSVGDPGSVPFPPSTASSHGRDSSYSEPRESRRKPNKQKGTSAGYLTVPDNYDDQHGAGPTHHGGNPTRSTFVLATV